MKFAFAIVHFLLFSSESLYGVYAYLGSDVYMYINLHTNINVKCEFFSSLLARSMATACRNFLLLAATKNMKLYEEHISV